MSVACVLQKNMKSTDTIWENNKEVWYYFCNFNIELFPLLVRFTPQKYLLCEKYTLVAQSSRFAIHENIVSRSQTSSLNPPPPPHLPPSPDAPLRNTIYRNHAYNVVFKRKIAAHKIKLRKITILSQVYIFIWLVCKNVSSAVFVCFLKYLPS